MLDEVENGGLAEDEPDTVAFSLKIKRELMDKIKEMADKDDRSINKEISHLVKRALECG